MSLYGSASRCWWYARERSAKCFSNSTLKIQKVSSGVWPNITPEKVRRVETKTICSANFPLQSFLREIYRVLSQQVFFWQMSNKNYPQKEIHVYGLHSCSEQLSLNLGGAQVGGRFYLA